MDPAIVEGLLKAIRDAVTTKHREDDVVLPPFEPEKNENGAESWCNSIDTIARDLGWSSATAVAKAGTALKGSALLCYETWDPEGGRSWDNFKITIKDLYPEKRNLPEKLAKAVLFSSDSSDSYCEYAREKLRLFKNTKVAFTEQQLVELLCGGIVDINTRMASYNSRVTTTAELISLFTTYAKLPKKRLLERSIDRHDVPTTSKRSRLEDAQELRCFLCNKLGHVRSQCFKNRTVMSELKSSTIPNDIRSLHQEGVSEAPSSTEAAEHSQNDGPLASDRDLFIDDDGSGLGTDESSGSGWGPGPGVDDEDARGSGDGRDFPEDDEDFVKKLRTTPQPATEAPSTTLPIDPRTLDTLPPVDYDIVPRILQPDNAAGAGSTGTGDRAGSSVEQETSRPEQTDISISGEETNPAVEVEHEGAESRPVDNVVFIMNAKPEDRATSFFAQPGILAAVIGGAVVGLLCAILVVMFIVYRMRKKDEGSYALDEPKRSPAAASYGKGHNNREFYA